MMLAKAEIEKKAGKLSAEEEKYTKQF